MKKGAGVLATVGVVLVCLVALGQQTAPAKLLLSYQKVITFMDLTGPGRGRGNSYDPNPIPGFVAHYPTDSMCLLVYGDGSYYFEKMEERTQGKPKIKAFKGTLTPADLQLLQSITEEQAFRNITSPTPPEPPDDAKYLKEGEVITTTVAREGGTQQFNLVRRRYATSSMTGMDKLASNWQGLEKTLKPFLSWVKDAEKKGQAGAKEATASGCPAAPGS